MTVWTEEDRRARLARRHLLTSEERTDDVVAVADALVALHSSDPVTVYLSVLARMRTPSLTRVEEALYAQRSLVRHHAMRRTLWVATPATVRRMHAAATRKVAAAERRRTEGYLRAAGIDDPGGWLDRARDHVVGALREHGPLTARQLGLLVPELAHPLVVGSGNWTATQAAHTRVVTLLGFEGVLVRTRPAGTWVNGQYTWALMEEWVPGGVDVLGEGEAAAALADHWLRRFGPATSTDLQWWAGWTKSLTSRALADSGAEPVELDGRAAWVAAGDTARQPAPAPWVALLPSLDPTVMGWKERGHYLPAEAAPAWDRNGNAGNTVWVDGRVVGAWAQAPDGRVRLHWFSDVPTSRRTEVERRAAEVEQWLGEVRYTVRFPGEISKELLS
ncbi:winged helix DNA-binding domain-containing protein [Ornithinimicrobium sediminis]|uniref:winged helix DNA-binding domain-containing protein n=1 Tax=Ornithinimicrobium sediminis TaxID=2904603 RepID=UPI001E37157E|nr:winged helix DNA-binding domain-containing protein [Ornithinimicrobium sediminis]